MCDILGPLKTYKEILKVFHGTENISNLDWVSLVAISPKDKLINVLKDIESRRDRSLKDEWIQRYITRIGQGPITKCYVYFTK